MTKAAVLVYLHKSVIVLMLLAGFIAPASASCLSSGPMVPFVGAATIAGPAHHKVAMEQALAKAAACVSQSSSQDSGHSDADNPGQWAFHCHHLYHMVTGMMATLSYET